MINRWRKKIKNRKYATDMYHLILSMTPTTKFILKNIPTFSLIKTRCSKNKFSLLSDINIVTYQFTPIEQIYANCQLISLESKLFVTLMFHIINKMMELYITNMRFSCNILWLCTEDVDCIWTHEFFFTQCEILDVYNITQHISYKCQRNKLIPRSWWIYTSFRLNFLHSVLPNLIITVFSIFHIVSYGS